MKQLLWATAAAFVLAAGPANASGTWITLAGEWQFALDPGNEGVQKKWFERRLEDRIALPGTTDENRKGTPNPVRDPARLTRVYPYAGAAWYQRDVDVPAAWNGKRIVLVLERTKSSRLWVDDREIGTQDSLVAPHEYELKALATGRHRLTLRINNAELAPIGDPHQISDHTQTNWNGVIGKIGLRVTDPVWLDEIQVYPDQPAHKIRVRVAIGNGTGNAVSGSVMLGVGGMKKVSVPFSGGTVETEYALDAGAVEWDEFRPALHTLSVDLEAGSSRDRHGVTFGLREFKA